MPTTARVRAVAVWALGGFYSSLGPAFTRLVSPGAPQAAGGLVFFTLTFCAALTVWATRSWRAVTAAALGSFAVIPAVLLSVGAMHLTSPALLFAGAALAGFGFGAVSQGALRMVLAPVLENERSGTLASYYVLSYLAMSLPAIGAGVLTVRYGLRTTDGGAPVRGCRDPVGPRGCGSARQDPARPLPGSTGSTGSTGTASTDPIERLHGPGDRTPPPHPPLVEEHPISTTPLPRTTGTTGTTGTDVPSWTVGDLTIRRVDEVRLPPQTGPWLLPGATPEVVARAPWLQPDFADEQSVLRLPSHSFAIEVNGLRVLVDTGIGNGKQRANPAWDNLDSDYLKRLTEAGFAPETVDLVVLTHLHTDHFGWNTRAQGTSWVPTFPNARYLTTRTEWDYWAGVDMDEARRQMFRHSVHPIRDAGLLDLVDVPDEGKEIAPGVRLVPTPGHTPGQVAVELRSHGESALVTGDSIHHPVQLVHPDLGSCVDIDPAAAARTRQRILGSLSGTPTLLLGSHFPPPTAGHVVPQGDTYKLVPSAPDSRG